MKSKISFFNKTIFWKNVTLYWPIWAIYTLLAFIYQPIILWLYNNMEYMAEGPSGYQDALQFRHLIDHLAFEPYVMLIAFASVLTGMALYSYMYNHKSANMIHSLPVDRTQLFGTALLSGWAFLIVPLLATALFTTLLCIVYTIPGVAYVWAWFLVVACTAIVAFSIVTICALFTGHIIVLPMYVVAVNLLSWIVYFLVYTVVTTFGNGVSSLGGYADTVAGILCPVQCFYENLYWGYQYAKSGDFVGASFEGIGVILLYMIIAVALYVAAYMIYRKRKIEQAGDFLTVNWVKPIFRGAVGIIGGIFGALLIREVLLETRIGCTVPVFVMIMLLIGAICYFAASMFIKKSFHVFQKRDWLRCGIFSVVLLIFYFGLYGVAEHYENYIPKESEVKSATVHLGYEITLEGEAATEIVEIHGIILNELDMIERLIESGDRDHNSVRISYTLESGEYVTRRYMLPASLITIQPAVDKIVALEADEENFLKSIFCEEYEKIKFFEGGYFEAPFIEGEERTDAEGIPNVAHDSIAIEPAQAKMLYEAIIADVKAGTFMKYNIGQYLYEEYVYFKGSDVCLTIHYKHPEDVEVYDNDDERWMETYVAFGPDCENLVKALIECGYVESVEDVWWGEAEELLETKEYERIE